MELNDSNYEELLKRSGKPAFIDFYSPTCAPCQILLEFIDTKLENYAKRQGVLLLTCNVSKNPKLANAFKIESVPFTICVLPDGKLKYPELGLKDESYYFSVIDKLSNKRKSIFKKLFG